MDASNTSCRTSYSSIGSGGSSSGETPEEANSETSVLSGAGTEDIFDTAYQLIFGDLMGSSFPSAPRPIQHMNRHALCRSGRDVKNPYQYQHYSPYMAIPTFSAPVSDSSSSSCSSSYQNQDQDQDQEEQFLALQKKFVSRIRARKRQKNKNKILM
jgi:hypothetical protein